MRENEYKEGNWMCNAAMKWVILSDIVKKNDSYHYCILSTTPSKRPLISPQIAFWISFPLCLNSVNDDGRLRITDAALAADLFPSDYEILGVRDPPKPLKWMAYELLTDRLLSTASDVVRLLMFNH